MGTYFADVLADESLCLANVNAQVQFTLWRDRVVGELMNPHSAYSHVVRLMTATPERTHFLERWRTLLAEAVERLSRPSPKVDPLSVTLGNVAISGSEGADKQMVDPDKAAMLILAALHGGMTLSRVGDDPQGSINAALDMALARLNGDDDDTGSEAR